MLTAAVRVHLGRGTRNPRTSGHHRQGCTTEEGRSRFNSFRTNKSHRRRKSSRTSQSRNHCNYYNKLHPRGQHPTQSEAQHNGGKLKAHRCRQGYTWAATADDGSGQDQANQRLRGALDTRQDTRRGAEHMESGKIIISIGGDAA